MFGKYLNRRDFLTTAFTALLNLGSISGVLAMPDGISQNKARPIPDTHVKDYLHKMKNFDQPAAEDIYLKESEFKLLEITVDRFKRLQKLVGHGNFCLLSFDDALKISHGHTQVGEFSKAELDFLECVFYENGSNYGFYGLKPITRLTENINTENTVKVPHSGNYLYKGAPLEVYNKIINDIGDIAILTSGLRSIPKQFFLFLNKALRNNGNLSLASRSLAPPGYSFHGIGDFDVGQINFGVANFTKRFTTSKVYERLTDLGYIRLRYPQKNFIGVRFEPWHIRITSLS